MVYVYLLGIVYCEKRHWGLVLFLKFNLLGIVYCGERHWGPVLFLKFLCVLYQVNTTSSKSYTSIIHKVVKSRWSFSAKFEFIMGSDFLHSLCTVQ